jgi:hypothetical protein
MTDELDETLAELDDRLDGITWAVTGRAAYHIYTGNEQQLDALTILLDSRDYMETSNRLGGEVVQTLDENGMDMFMLETELDGVPLRFETSGREQALDVFDRIEEQEYQHTTVPVVPAEYLIGAALAGELDGIDTGALKEIIDIDDDYMKRCMRKLGVAGGT